MNKNNGNDLYIEIIAQATEAFFATVPLARRLSAFAWHELPKHIQQNV